MCDLLALEAKSAGVFNDLRYCLPSYSLKERPLQKSSFEGTKRTCNRLPENGVKEFSLKSRYFTKEDCLVRYKQDKNKVTKS